MCNLILLVNVSFAWTWLSALFQLVERLIILRKFLIFLHNLGWFLLWIGDLGIVPNLLKWTMCQNQRAIKIVVYHGFLYDKRNDKGASTSNKTNIIPTRFLVYSPNNTPPAKNKNRRKNRRFSKKLHIISIRWYYWCCSRNKSFTVFTGLNVSIGTSTKMVFQSLMAPFQSPGNSRALSSFPPLDLEDIKPVFWSTYPVN